MNDTKLLRAAAAVAAGLALAGAASAVPVVLTDLNSQVEIDLWSSDGMSSWEVDGVDHLQRQWFWYRVDGGDTVSVDTLPLLSRMISDGNLNPGDDRVVALYAGGGLRITVDFTLTGGVAGSGASAIDEVLSVVNTGPNAVDFSLFQYADFDLNATAADDSVEITGGNDARQEEADKYISETIVGGMPDHLQVDAKDGANDILDRLAAGLDLTDAAGPVGPGDLTWAFQWDRALGPGDTLIISKKKNIVPEPGCLALMLLGGAAALARRRR